MLSVPDGGALNSACSHHAVVCLSLHRVNISSSKLLTLNNLPQCSLNLASRTFSDNQTCLQKLTKECLWWRAICSHCWVSFSFQHRLTMMGMRKYFPCTAGHWSQGVGEASILKFIQAFLIVCGPGCQGRVEPPLLLHSSVIFNKLHDAFWPLSTINWESQWYLGSRTS